MLAYTPQNHAYLGRGESERGFDFALQLAHFQGTAQ